MRNGWVNWRLPIAPKSSKKFFARTAKMCIRVVTLQNTKVPPCTSGWVERGCIFYSHPSRSTMNCIEYGVEHLRERWPSQNWNCGTVVDLTHRGASNWLKPAAKDIGRWHPAQFFHPSSMNCMMERCAFCLFFLWRMVAVFFVDDMVGGWLGGQRWTSQEFEWIAQVFLHFTLESYTFSKRKCMASTFRPKAS